MNCADKSKSMDKEYEAHEKCKTWQIIHKEKVPKGASIVKARWVNKIKLEANGSLRYKSRLVGKGFLDANSYKRGEIYAPVARLRDVRFIFIVAQKFGLKVLQYNIKTAFLSGLLEK